MPTKSLILVTSEALIFVLKITGIRSSTTLIAIPKTLILKSLFFFFSKIPLSYIIPTKTAQANSNAIKITIISIGKGLAQLSKNIFISIFPAYALMALFNLIL